MRAPARSGLGRVRACPDRSSEPRSAASKTPTCWSGAAQFVDDLPIAARCTCTSSVRRSPTRASRRSTPTRRARCPASSRCSPPPISGSPLYEGLMQLNDKCKRPAARRRQGAVRRRHRRRGRRRDARRRGRRRRSRSIVDYDPLPAVVDPEAALAPDAPMQFEELGSNLAAGDRRPRPGDDPLAGADVVVRARIENQRIAVMPMEGNAIAVVPGDDGDGHDLTVYVSTQMPHGCRAARSRPCSISSRASVRVVAPHVGGAFGGKPGLATEHTVAIGRGAPARTAGEVGRDPIREPGLDAARPRAGAVRASSGCKRDGTIVGMRCRIVGDAGAYAGFGGALAMGPTRMMAQGVYRIPKISLRVRGRADQHHADGRVPRCGPARGGGDARTDHGHRGRASSASIPAEIRRRNFLAARRVPVHDRHADRVRQRRLRRPRSTRRCASPATTSCAPSRPARRARGDRQRARHRRERVRRDHRGRRRRRVRPVTVHDDGTATIHVGTSAHGQGHATSFAMIVADRLGIPIDQVDFVQSDTAEVPTRRRHRRFAFVAARRIAVVDGGRRGARAGARRRGDAARGQPRRHRRDGRRRVGVAGVPAQRAARGRSSRSDEPIARGLRLQPGRRDVPVRRARRGGRGRPRHRVRHADPPHRGRRLRPHPQSADRHRPAARRHRAGHGAGVVGAVRLRRRRQPAHRRRSPTTRCRAPAEFPSFEASNTETPSPRNPLGAKGIGESGTIGSTPAVQSAVVDALAHLGVRHIDIPCTPERVWAAIRDAEAGELPLAVARTAGRVRDGRRRRADRPRRRRRDRHLMALLELLAGDPDEVIVYRDGVATTRAAVQAQAAALASELRAGGLGGRAIGVCMPNTAEAIAAWFGVWEAGATFVPLNPRVPEAEVGARRSNGPVVAAVVRPGSRSRTVRGGAARGRSRRARSSNSRRAPPARRRPWCCGTTRSRNCSTR